jgi:hypothetical protein
MSFKTTGRNIIRAFSVAVLVAMFSLVLTAGVSAHSVTRSAVTTSAQTEVFISLKNEKQIFISDSKVQFKTYTINLSDAKYSGSAHPLLSLPGIGQFTVRVYVFPFPGLGLYFPLATAKNLERIGTAAAAAIAAAIVAANHNLGVWAGLIGAVLGNILSSVPRYVVDTCKAAGGGFTVNFLAPIPVPFCGSLPVMPLAKLGNLHSGFISASKAS